MPLSSHVGSIGMRLIARPEPRRAVKSSAAACSRCTPAAPSGGVRVTCAPTDHRPVHPTVGYRFEHEGAVGVQRVEEAEGSMGFNAASGEMEDLIEAGVIDPVKVTRAALQNAASIAGLLLTTEALIADKPEESPAMPMGGDPMGGMGGMGMM